MRDKYIYSDFRERENKDSECNECKQHDLYFHKNSRVSSRLYAIDR